MAAQPSATRRPTYSSSSSSSSLHPHPIISQPPVSSRVTTRPSTSGSSAWVPTFSVSDSQMLNEHTVMSAEGFVAIPKSPTAEAANASSTTVMGGGGGKEKKEKGKKRAKVFALGKLMVKEVLGGGGNNNNITLTAAVQKEVVVSPKEKKAVHSYGRGGAARPKYKATNLLQPPTPSSAQSVEDSLSAQALRKTLTPLSAPHLPTHRSHSPNYDTLRAGRYPYPPAPATIGPSSTTRHDGYRAVHSPPPPSSVGSASVVSAPHYYGEYHRPSPPHHQYQRPQYQPQEQPQQQQQPPQHHHMRRKSSLSLQSATTLTTASSSGSFTAKTPSTAQTSNWVGSPQLVSSSAQQPYYGGTEAAASSYVLENTSRRRSMSASDIARLAEQDQQQQLYYGKTLPIMQQLAPPSAEQLDSFVPSVHRQASMQELQRTTKPARPRPAALHLGRTSPAPLPALHVVPDVIIDQGSPSEEESGFASPAPPVVVPRETAATKRSSKPLPKGYARGSVAGAGEDDTEWVLSESMTVVGFPTTQSSDSFQFDTKEGVKRSVSSVGSPPPAPVATGGKRDSRSRGGVEVMVVKEEWRSERDVSDVEEDGGDGEDEGYTSPDATPRGQRVAPAPAPAAAAVHPSPAPYAPSQQAVSRELPIPVVPPPYGAPLPQMQQQHLHYQHAPLPQMAGLPIHNMNVVPQISPLQLAALLPQMGAGMLAPQAAAPPNLLASLLAAQAPAIQQQQQQQQQQQLQQALELYLALANMNLALSAEQMRNAGSDSQ